MCPFGLDFNGHIRKPLQCTYIYIYTRRLMPPFGRPRCLGISGYAWHAWLRFKLCWSKLWLLALKSIKMSAVCFIRDVAAASGATMSQAPMPPLQIAPKYGRVLIFFFSQEYMKFQWYANQIEKLVSPTSQIWHLLLNAISDLLIFGTTRCLRVREAEMLLNYPRSPAERP